VDLRQLRYFVAAVEAGSLRAGAERMNVAQPALSRRIRDLEAGIGCRLLTRGASGVSVTAAGMLLYREATGIIEALDAAVTAVRATGMAQSGEVRLGLPRNSRRYSFLREAIASFRASGLQSELSFAHELSPSLINALEGRRLDMAVFYEPYRGYARLRERVLHRERFMLAIHPSHSLAQATPASLRDLRGVPIVWLNRDQSVETHDAIADRCKRAGFEPVISHVANSYEEEIDLTISGGGLFITAASTMLTIPPGALVYRPLPDFDFELHLKLAWAPQLDGAASRLLAHLEAAIDHHQSAIRDRSVAWALLHGQEMVLLPNDTVATRSRFAGRD